MKKLFLTILLIFAIQTTQAQSHQMGAKYNCKLKKGNPNTEGYPCEACTAKDKKEQNAKIAEDKRRFAVAQAEAEAKKAASEKVRLAKLAEEKKNAESGKVYINAQKNTVATSSNKTKIKSLEKNNSQKNYFYNFSNNQSSYDLTFRSGKVGFIVNGDTILKKNGFKHSYGIYSSENNKYNFPPNVGIVVLSQTKLIPPSNGRKIAIEIPISDLVNMKGERMINDDNISGILHFADDYFILLKGSFQMLSNYCSYEGAEIYNFKTQEKYPLLGYSGRYVYVALSKRTNNECANYCVKKEDLKPYGSYKAYLVTEVDWKKYVVYYINNESKIERQEINY